MGAEPSSTSSLSARSRTDIKDKSAAMAKEIQNTLRVGMDKKKCVKLSNHIDFYICYIADVNVIPI